MIVDNVKLVAEVGALVGCSGALIYLTVTLGSYLFTTFFPKLSQDFHIISDSVKGIETSIGDINQSLCRIKEQGQVLQSMSTKMNTMDVKLESVKEILICTRKTGSQGT